MGAKPTTHGASYKLNPSSCSRVTAHPDTTTKSAYFRVGNDPGIEGCCGVVCHIYEKSLALIGNASGQGAEVAGIAPRDSRQSGSNPQKMRFCPIGDDPTLEQTMPVLSGLCTRGRHAKKARQRAAGYGHAHRTGRCEIT